MELKEKLKALKDRLKNPFDYEGLEREFMELESLIKNAKPEEVRESLKDYEEVKKLLRRNLELFARLYGVG
ncbi:hypothetical protein JCM9492_03730 [Aquifex pyrophilus]